MLFSRGVIRPIRNETLHRATGVILAALLGACERFPEEPALRSIEASVLEDKIRGGWAGQMIGVSYGAPTEFQYLGELVPEERLVEWTPDLVAGALDQDDLYVDVALAGVLDDHGLAATAEDFGTVLRNSEFSLWHANLAARRGLRRGLPAVATGRPKNNAHANDIDFQIESDFIGLMTPGMPQTSNQFCERVGQVMNHGDGLYGGMFVSAMYAAAFFESDPRRIVEAGLAVLPAASPYAQTIYDVLQWSAEHPDDWIRAWQLVDERWNQREPCPEGALTPFNIDAKLNGAYVALGLLYGEGDLAKTMRIATRAGQDSDCNPATAAGILGVVMGYDRIPARYTSGFEAIADRKFSYTQASFRTIVDDTLRRAIAVIEREGGRRDGDTLLVRTQPPLPAELALWDDYGSPVERIPTSDDRWSWQGSWREKTVEKWGRLFSSRAGTEPGAQASIRFTGTGVIVAGWYLPSGGLADVYLDGELVATVDAYPDEDDVKFNESLWHAFGLSDSEHEIRLEVRGEPYVPSAGMPKSGIPQSLGADICLTELVVFR